MSLTTVNEDVEALRAELREKERDLLLAARYGKSLLEENDLLKEELENARQEHANITEVSELFGVCLVPSWRNGSLLVLSSRRGNWCESSYYS